MAHSTWFAEFVRKNYFAVFGHQVQNGTFDLIREVCEKELFRFIWPERLRKAQKAVFRCRMAHLTWFAHFVRKNYFALFGQQDSEKPKKPCLGAEWPIRLDSLSFWTRIISSYLANKTPKSLKNSVHVQNGPLDLIHPVSEKELFRRNKQAYEISKPTK